MRYPTEFSTNTASLYITRRQGLIGDSETGDQYLEVWFRNVR